MTAGDILTIFFILYYGRFLFSLRKKNIRQNLQTTNTTLDKMRKKPIKTLEEQKAFLDIKYPHQDFKFKFSWKGIGKIILQIIIYLILFKEVSWVFNYFNISFSLLTAILVWIIGPFIINFILSKFNMQLNDDLKIFTGWR